MPDISMCMNRDCPSRATCYRYLAVPTGGRQSYGVFAPNAQGRCQHYAHHDGSRRGRTLKEADKTNEETLAEAAKSPPQPFTKSKLAGFSRLRRDSPEGGWEVEDGADDPILDLGRKF